MYSTMILYLTDTVNDTSGILTESWGNILERNIKLRLNNYHETFIKEFDFGQQNRAYQINFF